MNPSSDAPLGGLKILLVEDSDDNRLLVERVLVKRGATVTTAENGEEAVERAAEKDFDVVLMDIQMPVMDGYTAMGVLKERNYRAPVIALTAHAAVEERARTRDAGFATHVTKPIEFAVLTDAIRSVVRPS